MAEDRYQDAPGFLREFLFYLLTVKGRSVRTVDAYYIDLRTFLRYLKCSKMHIKYQKKICIHILVVQQVHILHHLQQYLLI